jgi:hypothetical protein
MVVVPVKVNVPLTLAACAPAAISSARAKGANTLKMDPRAMAGGVHNPVTKRIMIIFPPNRALSGPASLHYTTKLLET